MPITPLPYKCGTPGCNRKFAKPEYLHQHTQDFHPSPKTPPKETFKCGVVGCKVANFRQLSSLHQHTKDFHSSPKFPPKETFKCGAVGCKAASFPQLSLLHQHTADAHPKLKKSDQIRQQPARSQSTPSGFTQHFTRGTASEAGYALPHDYFRQPSTASASLSTQNAESSPDYAPAVFATPPLLPGEGLSQRLAQLELRLGQMLIDKSTLKVGMNFVELAENVILSSTNNLKTGFWNRLREQVEWMGNHNNVYSLAYSVKFRADVRMLLQDFGYNDDIKIQKAFLEDDQVISHLFREVIHSSKEEVLQLSDEKVAGFMDALHKQCTMASDDVPFVFRARRLLKNLCAVTEGFPPSLFLKVDSVDTNRQIGRGGFADIFLGRYKDQDIALKRLQVYKPEPSEMLKFSKNLLQEVITWVHLKHIYVLPFLGLDSQSFEGYPPCIVTPYMCNGTMTDFVKNRNGTLSDSRVDRLLFETAQGLAYLHSQNIVHGDLRGGNVLIDGGEHAQLADFGLAIVTDATLGATSTTQRGSSRWMAPELHNYQLEFKRTKASDVYAFACLCLEIYTGEQPFWDIKQEVMVAMLVLDQKRPPQPLGPPDGTRAMSNRLWAIVEACWAHGPSDRPDMNKVLELIMASP